MSDVATADAAKFSDFCVHWQERFALTDWRLTVSERRARRKVMAEVAAQDLEQRMVTIRLGKSFAPHPVNDDTLNQTACHEMLHVLLHELIETAKKDPEDEDVLRSAEHRVINVLERLLTEKT